MSALRLLGRHYGKIMFGIALAVFIWRTPLFAVPGEWTDALTAYAGFHPFKPMSHPFWGAIMTLFCRLFSTAVVPVANVFSALCGAGVVWLVFGIVSRTDLRAFHWTRNPPPPKDDTEDCRLMAGVVSAIGIICSLPLSIAFTRATPLALDAFLWTLAVWLTAQFHWKGGLKWWFGFAFLFGVGCAEFSTFVLTAPLFAAAWFWLLWRRKNLNQPATYLALPLFLLGLSVLFLSAWLYYRSPAAGWRELDSYGEVLKYFLLDQWRTIRFGVPRVGWLSILLLMLLPGVWVFTSGMRNSGAFASDLGHALLRLTLFLLAAVIWLDLPTSPWRMGEGQLLVLIPYVFASLWIGHLAGTLLFYVKMSLPPRTAWERFVRFIGLYGVSAALVILFSISAARHFSYLDPQPLKAVHDYVARIPDQLEGRTALVTDGVFDSLLTFAAREKAPSLLLLNRRMARARPYLHFLATKFDDADRRSLVESGLQPLLDFWVRDRDRATKELASWDGPDMWQLRGVEYLPHHGIVFGLPPRQTVDRAALWANERAFFEPFLLTISGWKSERNGEDVRRYLAMRISRYLNDLGVFFSRGRAENEAWQAFALARQFNRDNVSALANQLVLARRAGRAQAPVMESRLKEVLARQPKGFHILMAVARDGYIDDSEIYAQEGLALMNSGMSGYGFEKLTQAAGVAGASMDPKVRERLASGDEKIEDDPVLFRDMLTRNPGNLFALAQLERQALEKGRLDEAESYLARMKDAGAKEADIVVRRSLLLLSRGKTNDAVTILRNAAAQKDSPPTVWVTLGAVAMRRGDTAEVARVVAKLVEFPKFLPGHLFLADRAAANGDHDAWERELIEAYRIDPANRVVLGKLMEFAVLKRDPVQMRKWAEELLHIEPRNPAAHYSLGVAYMQEGRRELAMASMRRSIECQPNLPALNDLAWILQSVGKFDDAVKLAQQATQLAPNYPLVWATYGLALSKKNQPIDAANAFERAVQLGLRPDDALLSAARVLLDAGRTNAAVIAFRRVTQDLQALNADQKKSYQDLAQELEGHKP